MSHLYQGVTAQAPCMPAHVDAGLGLDLLLDSSWASCRTPAAVFDGEEEPNVIR